MMNKNRLSIVIGMAFTGFVMSGMVNADSYNTEKEIEELNNSLPNTFKRLLDNNVKVVSKFQAEKGYIGYVVKTPQDKAIVYHDPEKNISFSGMMIGENGKNLTRLHHETKIEKTDYSHVLERVVDDNTILTEGNDDAEKELWIFFDPNCPYCNKLWKSSREFIESGYLKVNWMPVAFLRDTSAGKVAHFWQAEDPIKTFREAELKFSEGGAEPVKQSDIKISTKRMLDTNLEYMRDFDSNGTPTIVYETKNGRVEVISSSMSEERMKSFLENDVK